MRLQTPCPAIEFDAQTIHGKPIKLSDYKGKALILSFFRDTARPLRNRRVFELTRNYKLWKKNGIEVVVIFAESHNEVRDFFSKHTRPFPVVADPELKLYEKYGLERMIGDSKISPLLKSPTFFDKMFKGERARLNPGGRIMPADFLIDVEGNIVDSWYGKNELDHMPLERLEIFVMAMRVAMGKKMLALAS